MNEEKQQNEQNELSQNEPSKQASTPDNSPAIQGSQKIEIDQVFSQAYELSKGFKGRIFLALLVYVLIYLPILGVQVGLEYYGNGGTFDTQINPDAKSITFSFLGQLITWLLITPLSVGVAMMVLKHVRGQTAKVSEVYSYYPIMIPLFVTLLTMYLLVSLGFILLIIPGIYLLVAYYFSTMLVADKGLGPWQALETSRKRVSRHWFTVFLSFLGLVIFNLVAMIPFGIGLIWSIPWSMLVYAVLYQRLFDDLA